MTDLFDIPRRVHISEKTLQCLSGEFEVEPAFGEKREETLRAAGLKTYFIKNVLIPVSELSTLTERNWKMLFALNRIFLPSDEIGSNEKIIKI